jgi:transposase-like protein
VSTTSVKPKQSMNLVKLIEAFGSEDRCRDYLIALRWPDGKPRCPRCGFAKTSWISTRKQFDCNNCRYRFSATAGTVFHDSHLPLWKWFLATYMMVESRKGISSNQLKRTLAVSYKTAWYLTHRIRWAMQEAFPAALAGTVEVDETYVGGQSKNMHKADKERRGITRGSYNGKTMVLGAIQRGGELRLRVEKRKGTSTVLQGFVHEVVRDDAEAIYTDQNNAYIGLRDLDTRHETVNHFMEEWVRGDVSTNTVESAWSLLKRSIVGSYHQLSAKHLQAYLDEFSFRFNGRENPFLFRDTLLKLLSAEALRYSELIASAR